ncbi:alkaline shock response membrane anchor protein AmaP [Desulfolucanica intricata]|uniref:alkaline shock response membrane anchor protein AmaP n=1 Tax=Desulfolucanica intricata TaxID=1285191 RepID=UPI000830660A|nr:alkaline shock response membrane anchor protein AmaP [Desulfolucanica intricata]
MGPFDRTILSLYTFVLNLIIIIALLVLAGWRYPLNLMQEAIEIPAQKEILFTLLGLFGIGGMRLFWVSLRHRKKGKHAIINENSLGQVRISLQALVNLVEKIVLEEAGIRQVKPKVIEEPAGISININVVVTPDIKVPEITNILQQRVKEYVFNVTGITVNNIKVVVENFAVNKPRVE